MTRKQLPRQPPRRRFLQRERSGELLWSSASRATGIRLASYVRRHAASSSSRAFACFRSNVSNPSVNQP
jgi:hypothetical protein